MDLKDRRYIATPDMWCWKLTQRINNWAKKISTTRLWARSDQFLRGETMESDCRTRTETCPEELHGIITD